ncbi:MAG: prolyl oligopeptidase family serine peptidase [Sphingomonadaceae bacterium]|nr:prolyl oligopeptidase family serine peptidase [Sphingomonadaceae bacterium]
MLVATRVAAVSMIVCAFGLCAAAASARAARDPYLWLEPSGSPRALAQVQRWNSAAAAGLHDAGFAALKAGAEAVLSDPHAIASAAIQGSRAVNFRIDAAHPRGTWRAAELNAYLSGRPQWRTLIDVDALAKAEGRDLVWKGAICARPLFDRCMIGLSDGGSDALGFREFDPATARFVPGGFATPRAARTSLAWVGRDELLISGDFGPGSLTRSGYGREVRRWRRGEPLSAAQPVARIGADEVSLAPRVFWNGGRAWPVLIRTIDFWRVQYTHVRADGALIQSPLPPGSVVDTVVGGRLIARLSSPWALPGRVIPSGAVVSYDIAALERGADPQVQTVFVPDARTAISQVAGADGVLYVALMTDVQGRIAVLMPGPDGWTEREIALPPLSAVRIHDVDAVSEMALVGVSSLTEPDQLLALRPGVAPSVVARAPARPGAGPVAAEQRFATSADGTRVPYFLLRPRGASGPLPVLLHVYGGFRAPSLPVAPPLAQLWVAGGGAYAIANVRGGGEYGLSWHAAATGHNRQAGLDDLHAIASDLRSSGAASRIAVEGQSNGGLVAAAAVTQRPDLYDGAIAGSPLLDMRRYTRLGAGASWVAEYGDPDRPKDWAALKLWSPYQNLKPGVRYPPILLLTTTSDDRVPPAHARKFAARLEALGLPFFFVETPGGGHGGAGDLDGEAARLATMLSYLNLELGLPRPELAGFAGAHPSAAPAQPAAAAPAGAPQ